MILDEILDPEKQNRKPQLWRASLGTQKLDGNYTLDKSTTAIKLVLHVITMWENVLFPKTYQLMFLRSKVLMAATYSEMIQQNQNDINI